MFCGVIKHAACVIPIYKSKDGKRYIIVVTIDGGFTYRSA